MPEPADPTSARPIDFAVIGAAKSGTSTLWEAVRHHPEILAPPDKERSFFNSDPVYAGGLAQFVERTFPAATPKTKIGLFSPILMAPSKANLESWSDRMATTCPDMKIIAILREPIGRAQSHLRMAKRRGRVDEDATLQQYIENHPGLKSRGPFALPGIADSNYGQILSVYAERFPREQILVLFTQDLDQRPREVYRDFFSFVGVDPDWEPSLPRVNVGGSAARVTDAALAEIGAELNRSVIPFVDEEHKKNVRAGFNWWLRNLWNIEPDAPSTSDTEISPEFRAMLAEHYLQDARLLEEILGVTPPWVPDLEAAVAAASPVSP